MAGGQISLKRIGVDKTNARIVLVTAVAAFLVVFFLIASYMLFTQLVYQNKVIGVKRAAVKQLRANITARDSLVNSYKAFVSAPQNMLGGNPNGNGANDGNNAKIVLDALPSKYDFPALTASLEKLLTGQKVKIESINGTDEEATQGQSSNSGLPATVEIPFDFTASGDYNSIRNVIDALGKSIRPFQVLSTEVSGDQSNLKMKVTGKTYYQPESGLKIEMKVVPSKGKVTP